MDSRRLDSLRLGSLRRAGNRLRITAQLVETQSGHTLWAQRYDREMADVFEVQDEIARSIAQAFRINLSPQEEKKIAEAVGYFTSENPITTGDVNAPPPPSKTAQRS